jgi:DNA modification methylase
MRPTLVFYKGKIGFLLDKRQKFLYIACQVDVKKIGAIKMAEIEMIPIDLIVPGPWSRSIFYKDEIIKAICDTIRADNGLKNIQPLSVKKIHDTKYQLIDGEARFNAVKIEGRFDKIPCNVMDVTEYDALLYFARSNNKHKLSPLQIGRLGVLLENGIGGRTETGDWNTSPKGDLARITGTDRGNLTRRIQAARVFNSVENLLDENEAIILNKKADQLSKIVDIPENCLLKFVKAIASGIKPDKVEKGIRFVDEVGDIEECQYCFDTIAPLDELLEMNFADKTGAMVIKPLFDAVVNTKKELERAGRHDELEQFGDWLRDNAIKDGNLRWRDVRSKCLELQGNNSYASDNIVNDDARNFVETLGDNTIDGCFLDFPYGVGYHDIGTSGHAIEGDTRGEAVELHSFIAQKLYEKMRDNAYLVVWFAPSNVDVIMPVFKNALFKFQSFYVWEKGNHTQSTLSQPLVQTEHAMIFSKGSPVWLTRTENFLKCATPDPKQHPCEKPLALCQRIVQSILAPGQTLLDLSFGSGNALKAGRLHGCRILGCEKDLRHYTNGFNNIYQDDEGQVA